MLYSEILFAMLFDVALLGTELDWRSIVGAACIMTGSVVSTIIGIRNEQKLDKMENQKGQEMVMEGVAEPEVTHSDRHGHSAIPSTDEEDEAVAEEVIVAVVDTPCGVVEPEGSLEVGNESQQDTLLLEKSLQLYHSRVYNGVMLN